MSQGDVQRGISSCLGHNKLLDLKSFQQQPTFIHHCVLATCNLSTVCNIHRPCCGDANMTGKHSFVELPSKAAALSAQCLEKTRQSLCFSFLQ